MKYNYFAQIGKSAYVAMLGVQENFKEVQTVEQIDEQSCINAGCQLYYLKKELANNPEELKKNPDAIENIVDKCCRNCSTAYSCTTKAVYHNEKNKYQTDKLYNNNNIRFSKSQLKQFLLYHFLVSNNSGLIHNISEKEVAKALNCSERTVRNNNKFLLKHLYVSICYASEPGTFTVLIRGYKDRALPAEQGGRGYLVMPKETFEALLSIQDVNELRSELRLFLKADDYKNSENKSQISTSVKSLRRKLPKYLTPKKVVEILNNIKENSLFNFNKIANEEIVYRLKEDFDPVVKATELQNSFTSNFVEYCTANDIVLDAKTYADLVQMSFQYNHETVMRVLITISEKIVSGLINNIGGYIREVIIAETLRYPRNELRLDELSTLDIPNTNSEKKSEKLLA